MRRYQRDTLVCLGVGLVLQIGLMATVVYARGWRRGTAAVFVAMAPVYLGIGASYLVERRRRRIVARLREIGWRACTECAYELDDNSTRCPECGLQITAREAALAWRRCRLAQHPIGRAAPSREAE